MHILKKSCIFVAESPTSGFRGWEVSPLGKPICMTKDPSRGFQDILYIGVKTGNLAFMAKRCPKRFVLGFTESGKFYFYSKTLQQLMSSGYVYLVPRVFIRYTRVRAYSAWTSVLLVRNKGQYQSLVKRNSNTQSRFFYLHKCWHLLMKSGTR